MNSYDPVLRKFRSRHDKHDHQKRTSSYKCWNDQCVHYVYGFDNEQDREAHVGQHSATLKNIWLRNESTIERVPTLKVQQLSSIRTSPSLSRLTIPSDVGYPKPQPVYQQNDTDMSIVPPIISPTYRRSIRPRSPDLDTDSQLPPLKKARTGQPRLESIQELQLFREQTRCLRCRLLKLEVSLNTSKSLIHG